MPVLGHRRALDGIRGLAILGVLLLHSAIWGDVPSVMPGGNLGVSVFFVLSGYLITRLLLEEHETAGDIDLRAFYLRRAARLLPALLVLLPVYIVVFSRALTPKELLLPALSAVLYLSSFVQSIWGAMGNLGFTWSLSVEEHFYALWPPLLRWLLRRGGAERGARVRGGGGGPGDGVPGGGGAGGGVRDRRMRARAAAWLRGHPVAVAAGVAVTLVLVATILRVVVGDTHRGRAFAYYNTLTRMDGLGVGCLAALAGARRRIGLPRLAGWGALAVIAWCYLQPGFSIGSVSLNLYGLPLCTVAAAVLVLAVVEHPRSWLSRMLAWRPLAHLGTISYGLYIWNLMPGQTFRVFEGRHPGLVGTVACAVVIVAVVELSYYWLERPFMRWARRRMAHPQQRPRRVLTPQRQMS